MLEGGPYFNVDTQSSGAYLCIGGKCIRGESTVTVQWNLATKIETNKILIKKEKVENLLQNFQATVNMSEEIKAGVEVKAEMEAQKVVSNVYLSHMRGRPYK